MNRRNGCIFHSQLWKAYSEFPGREEYELGWTCSALKKALNKYHNYMNDDTQSLIFPEHWKTFAEEADVFSSIICRSLKRYLDYLVNLSELFMMSIPYLAYGSYARIEGLKFPYPQIIPNHPDPLQYYTRLSRAILHILSYPGLTTCRCEMDAERNTSLLLYSLFDWFGVILQGSSRNDSIDSIRVFKRSPHPQWTRDGLAPIVFFPQQVRSISEHRYVAWALPNGKLDDFHVPDKLIPLASAVEQTLKVLLVHAVNVWKKERETGAMFVLSEWLFIHGVVYDALQIDVYAFIPKILKCDNNGVPSKWEFVCTPARPLALELFADRVLSQRMNRIAVLLAIKRHADRISQVLNGLDVASLLLQDPNHLETVQCVADDTEGMVADSDAQKKAAEAAAQCLLDCIHRTGLNDSSLCQRDSMPSNWSFLDALLDIDTIRALGSRKCFLAGFIDNWQSRNSGKIHLPEDWLTTTHTLDKDEIRYMSFPELNQILPKVVLQTWISGRKDDFFPLTNEELWARHFDPQSFSPDFYLSTPARKQRLDVYDPIPLDNLCPNAIHSLEHFKDVFQYVSHESEAKMAISSPFMCTPGCWLKYDTESRFPSVLTSESPPQVDFSLLLHSVQTVSIEMSPVTPDVSLRATILNPALVVAIQGPALWPDEFACSPASSCSRPKDKSEALRQLAKAIEPSLKTHLINWQLRFEQGLTPTKDLPPWFMLFGIIYDAEEVTIVAHIPYMNDDNRYSFVSCIVDTISFPPVPGSAKVSEPWFLDRFRVGLALLSLQKHAFRMAGLWECVVWPDELVSWEEILEREYLGPVLTPAERGYMVEPHPMTQLYLKIHGSDETLDERSGTSDDEEDGEEQSEEEDDEQEEDWGDGNGNPAVDDSISLSKAIVEWRSQIHPCAR